MQMPWTTVEALVERGEVPWEGQDSGFIWVEENRIIMCDPDCTGVDFDTKYQLTEDEIKAVRDAIHELAEKWDNKVVDELNEQDYKTCVELYDESLCVYARVAKDDYDGPIRHENDELSADVQEAFDKLGFQVVLNAMIHYGMVCTDEPLYWRIY